MNLVDDLRRQLATCDWEPVEIERGDRRLQLHPVQGKLGAGFTLWERAGNGSWAVRATGHTENGRVVDSSGDPLSLADDVRQGIAELLDGADG